MSNPNPAFVSVLNASGFINLDYSFLTNFASTINGSTMASTIIVPQTTVQTGNLVYPANYGSYYQITSNPIFDQNTGPAALSSFYKAGNAIAVPTFTPSTLNVGGPNITGSGEPGSGNTGA